MPFNMACASKCFITTFTAMGFYLGVNGSMDFEIFQSETLATYVAFMRLFFTMAHFMLIEYSLASKSFATNFTFTMSFIVPNFVRTKPRGQNFLSAFFTCRFI